jgi:Dolichyl-phosphate-mannose-protein mannosyltransferase
VTSAARQWVAVAAAFCVVTAAVSLWLAIDRRPAEWDYANHLEHALRCRADLAGGAVGAVFARSSFYPPLVPCAAGLVYGLLPSDVVFGEIVILAFLALGMAATYVLGRQLAGGTGGVVAAIVFGTAPITVDHVLHFQLDVPLAAMVAAFLAALFATQGLERRARTLFAGLLFGLGMLTKPPFFVLVGPACVLAAMTARSRRAWLNAGLASVTALLVALPWYGPRAFGLAAQFENRSFKQAEEAGFPAAMSPASLAYYPLNFPAALGAVAVVLVLVGLWAVLRRRCWFVLAGLSPLLVFLVLRNKQMRYALPLLPMIGVTAALGFVSLPRTGRRLAGVALACVAALEVSWTAFGVPDLGRVPWTAALVAPPAPPSPAEWQHRAIFRAIGRDSGGAPASVSVAANHQFFSPANFRYLALRDGLPLRVARAWEGEPIAIEYMILKTGDLGPPLTVDKARRVAERLSADAALARAFPIIGEFPLPDGSTASVRARRLDGNLDVTPAALARGVGDGLRARLGEVMRDVQGLDVRVDYDARILSGRVRRLVIAAAAASIGEWRHRQPAALRVRDLRLVIDDALVNPWSARAGRFDPLDAGRLTVERATVEEADLRHFLPQVRGIGRMSLMLGDGVVDLAFAIPGPDVGARVRFVTRDGVPFALAAERVSVGGLPVPALLVDAVMRGLDPARGLAARLPIAVAVAPITVTPGAVRIGGP